MDDLVLVKCVAFLTGYFNFNFNYIAKTHKKRFKHENIT